MCLDDAVSTADDGIGSPLGSTAVAISNRLSFVDFFDKSFLYNANQPNSNKRVLGRYKCSVLKSIPSFSSVDEDDEELLQNIRGGGGGETVTAAGGGEFRLNNGMAGTALSEEVKVMEALWNAGFEQERGTVGQEMYLAKGLGVGGRGGRGGGTGGGGSGFYPAGSGGDSQGVEEYYKKMVEENPGNPLFLSNYAQFLYQSKQDLPKAEEYYSRAILADPGDGEILSQYANLVWELHNDQDRAATYYERAVHASPEDSHVHASYAGFLWETEEDNDECDAPSELDSNTLQIGHAAVASANA